MAFVIVGCLALFFAVTDAVRVTGPELDDVGEDENVLSGNLPIQLLGTRKNLPETDCTESTVKWSLENTHVYSNLVGRGPDQGPRHEVRMSNVAQVNGVAVDLVIKNTSEYRAWSHGDWAQGDDPLPQPQEVRSVSVENGLGRILLHVDSETTFRFALMKHDTETEVEVPHFRMTWMDFDSASGIPEREYLKFDTPISELPSPLVGNKVEMVTAEGKYAQVQSITGSTQDSRGGKDNPTSTVLSDHQKGLSVEFGYTGVTHWSLTIGHKHKTWGGDRQFYFAGNIISCQCREKAIKWTMQDGQMYSNLVGNGPDQGPRHEVRIWNVAQAYGDAVDLVIKNISEYRAWSHGDWEEGDPSPLPSPQEVKSVSVSNSLGLILLHVERETTFRFAFMKHNTETEVELPAFLMTWMDFDSAVGPPEREYLKFDTAVQESWVGNKVERTTIGNDILQVQSTTGSTQLTSGGKDNPTGLVLNVHQKQRSAEVCYSGVKHWDLTLGHIHKKWAGDRTFYFAGIRL